MTASKVLPRVSQSTRSGQLGFTLIELLTVVAIIALLIGLLIPSLSKARDSAKNVKTKATMKSLGDGLEMFRGENDEECQGQNYPSSAAGDDPTATGDGSPLKKEQIFGAQWLVRYLTGKKLDGYVPKRNVPKLVDDAGDPATGWGQKFWYAGPDDTDPAPPSTIKDLLPVPRAGPYVTNAPVMPPRDLPGGKGDADVTPAGVNWVYVDAFKMPICYYAANSRHGAQVNPNIATFTGNSIPGTFKGIYEFRDNALFTGLCTDSQCMIPNWDFGGGDAHISFGPDEWTTTPKKLHDDIGKHTKSFPYLIMDAQAWETSKGTTSDAQAIVRPLRPDSFLLWSPGKDGIFGTADDITNFR